MSIEAAMAVWTDGTTTLHEPEGRSAVWIPDTQSLWDIVSENKDRLDGIAHSHPGRGYMAPSSEDISTFRAMEKGLGRRIKWWILTSNRAILVEWSGSGLTGYELKKSYKTEEEPAWMNELRRASYPEVRTDPE